jgi:hypothetical protein
MFEVVSHDLAAQLDIIYSEKAFDAVFYMKLSFSLPMVFAIVFCTVQYSRERRLEEEYAFKANISISLVPYQELVDKLVDRSQAGEREKYTAFIIDSVTKVFTSPTDKIFDTHDKKPVLSDKTVKQIAALIKPIVKGLKHQ